MAKKVRIKISKNGVGKGFFDKRRPTQINIASRRVNKLSRQKKISLPKARFIVGKELQAIANITGTKSPRKKEINREVRTIRNALQKRFPRKL